MPLTGRGERTGMNIQKMAEGVKENIGQVIVDEDEVIELALVALLGGLQQ
jgi:MoxR-like ATPase